MTPIAKWGTYGNVHPGLVWGSELDGRYQVEVQANVNDHYLGTLVIFDHNDSDKVIHSEVVGVSYGAMFGADVMDINAWAARAIQIVDGLANG